MRIEIYIYCVDLTVAVRFYVNEIKLFTISQEFDGSVLMASILNPELTILLSEDVDFRPVSSPIFSLGVSDSWKVYQEMKSLDLSVPNSGVFSHNGVPDFLRYPSGEGFAVRDPSGNIFSIQRFFRGVGNGIANP